MRLISIFFIILSTFLVSYETAFASTLRKRVIDSFSSGQFGIHVDDKVLRSKMEKAASTSAESPSRKRLHVFKRKQKKPVVITEDDWNRLEVAQSAVSFAKRGKITGIPQGSLPYKLFPGKCSGNCRTELSIAIRISGLPDEKKAFLTKQLKKHTLTSVGRGDRPQFLEGHTIQLVKEGGKKRYYLHNSSEEKVSPILFQLP